jgi:hypothetical protein
MKIIWFPIVIELSIWRELELIEKIYYGKENMCRQLYSIIIITESNLFDILYNRSFI